MGFYSDPDGAFLDSCLEVQRFQGMLCLQEAGLDFGLQALSSRGGSRFLPSLHYNVKGRTEACEDPQQRMKVLVEGGFSFQAST